MNITKKFRQFAAAAMLLATPAVHAALPYADGDLILGFRATGGQGGTSSYEVNIGSATQFVAASTFSVDLGGNITTDLEAIFLELSGARAGTAGPGASALGGTP